MENATVGSQIERRVSRIRVLPSFIFLKLSLPESFPPWTYGSVTIICSFAAKNKPIFNLRWRLKTAENFEGASERVYTRESRKREAANGIWRIDKGRIVQQSASRIGLPNHNRVKVWLICLENICRSCVTGRKGLWTLARASTHTAGRLAQNWNTSHVFRTVMPFYGVEFNSIVISTR